MHFSKYFLIFVTYNIQFQVHSVVDDVVFLELHKNKPNNQISKPVNQIMIEQGFAEPSMESFLSKVRNNFVFTFVIYFYQIGRSRKETISYQSRKSHSGSSKVEFR